MESNETFGGVMNQQLEAANAKAMARHTGQAARPMPETPPINDFADSVNSRLANVQDIVVDIAQKLGVGLAQGPSSETCAPGLKGRIESMHDWLNRIQPYLNQINESL